MKLVIKGFRSIENKTFDFKGSQLICAANGAGKTSVVEAIRWAFTGNIDKTNIRDVADEAFVEVTFDDGFTFSRKVKKDGAAAVCKLFGKTITASALKTAIEEKFGCFIESIDACIGIQTFSSKGLSESLGKYLDPMTEKELFFYGNIEDEDEKMFMTFFPDAESFTVVDVLNAYKSIYAERKATNALIKELKAFPAVEKPTKTADEINSEIAELDKTLAVIMSAKKSKEQAERIAALKEEIAAMEKSLSTMPAYKTTVGDDDIETAKKKSTTNRNEAVVSKSAAESSASNLKKAIEALSSNKCPLSDKIVCMTPKTGLIKDLEKAVAALEESVHAYESVIAREDGLLKIYADIIAANTMRAKAEEALENKKKLVEAITVDEVAVPDGVTAEDISAKKTVLLEVLRNIGRYEESLKKQELLVEQTAKKAQLESFLLATAGDGTIVSCKYDEYARDINEKIAESNNTRYEVQIVGGQGIEVRVRTPKSDDFMPFDSLSSGEKATTGILILNCIANVACVPFLVVDGTEVVDDANFEALHKFAKAATEYEFILLTRVK